jgi:predicted nucleic acid-binding protein
MTCYVVDASVAVKWFVPEASSHVALRFLNVDHELIAPDLLIPELGNTLWKKVMRKEISLKVAKEILQKFDAAPIKLYPSAPMLEVALDISIEERRSVYDTLYLALAVVRKCQMVTADEKLVNSLKDSRFAEHLLRVQ